MAIPEQWRKIERKTVTIRGADIELRPLNAIELTNLSLQMQKEIEQTTGPLDDPYTLLDNDYDFRHAREIILRSYPSITAEDFDDLDPWVRAELMLKASEGLRNFSPTFEQDVEEKSKEIAEKYLQKPKPAKEAGRGFSPNKAT